MTIFLFVTAAAISSPRARCGLVIVVYYHRVAFLAAGLIGVDGGIKFIDGYVYSAFLGTGLVTVDAILG